MLMPCRTSIVHAGMTRLQLGHGVRLSAWRWTSIVLEMRVEFKRLATRIENNDEPVEARESLRKLIQQSLSANMSADEADLLCETFRGIEALALQEVRVLFYPVRLCLPSEDSRRGHRPLRLLCSRQSSAQKTERTSRSLTRRSIWSAHLIEPHADRVF